MFFGRLNKYQLNYHYLVKLLKESNIDTEEKIQKKIKQAIIRAYWFSVVIITIATLIINLVPRYFSIWGILTILALAWIWASALSAVKIMRQYNLEVLKNKGH